MTEHTPGPWQSDKRWVLANGTTNTYAGPVQAAIAEFLDLAVQDGEGREWASGGTPEANARLAAAAPDLLAAAQDALAVAGAGLHLAGENMEALRRAINKATAVRRNANT